VALDQPELLDLLAAGGGGGHAVTQFVPLIEVLECHYLQPALGGVLARALILCGLPAERREGLGGCAGHDVLLAGVDLGPGLLHEGDVDLVVLGAGLGEEAVLAGDQFVDLNR